jgi:hypothetical protein
MELGSVMDVITLGVVSVGGYLVSVAKVGFEARVRTTVEESVKAAVKNENWPLELARELEKARGTERQERRFKSYGLLWERLRPLAIYDDASFGKEAAAELSKHLTGWYFSADGGLMLTAPLRELYFTLQDLLLAVAAADLPAWQTERAADPKTIFTDLVADLPGASRTLAYLEGDDSDRPIAAWPRDAMEVARGWRADIRRLHERWSDLAPRQRFAVLQQTASVLRTAMATDVESRMR